jgi:hypothetical protein
MLTVKKTGIEKQRTFLSLMIGTYGMTKKGTIFDGSNG